MGNAILVTLKPHSRAGNTGFSNTYFSVLSHLGIPVLSQKKQFRLIALLLVLHTPPPPPLYIDHRSLGSPGHVHIFQEKNEWTRAPDSLWASRWQNNRNTLSIPQGAKRCALNSSYLKTFKSLAAIDLRLTLLKTIKLHQGSIWFFRYLISMANKLLFSLPFEQENYCNSPWLEISFFSTKWLFSLSGSYLGSPCPPCCHTGDRKVQVSTRKGLHLLDTDPSLPACICELHV